MTVERRSIPRYPLAFPVEVSLESHPQDLEFEASSLNISKSSIEVNCDKELIDHLLAQDKYPHTCHLTFKIPETNHVFEVESQVVSQRRLSQKSFRLVLIFPDLEHNNADLLDEYLSALQVGDYKQALSAS